MNKRRTERAAQHGASTEDGSVTVVEVGDRQARGGRKHGPLYTLTVLLMFAGTLGVVAFFHGHRVTGRPSSTRPESSPSSSLDATSPSVDLPEDRTALGSDVDLEMLFSRTSDPEEDTFDEAMDAPVGDRTAMEPEPRPRMAPATGEKEPDKPTGRPAAPPETASVPDFTHSRPKGPRQLPEPLPSRKPEPPAVSFGKFRPFNPIDHFVLAVIKERGAVPLDVCDDWDFARRASLGLVGVIPTQADLARHFDGPKEKRRKQWVDMLLEQPQYADHWAVFWGDLLRQRDEIRGVPENAMKAFLRASLREDRPYDAWVRALITASGPAEENPATAFVLRDRADADVLTVSVAQVFLGVQLRCAQCHDHPYDWWTEKDFAAMSAFWRGTRQYVDRTETVMRNGREITERFLGVRTRDRRAAGVFLTGASSEDGRGRAALADLVTRRDNPYFARAVVNRLWAALMGVGLVEPVDNFSVLNPPSHPELLDWLALELIEHDYSLKHVLRLIANSRTYQQTSSEKVSTWIAARRRAAEDSANGALFDGMPLRRMTAEQVHDSILMATGRYGTGAERFRPAIEVRYPPGPRSFLRAFGASDRETLLSEENHGSIQQSLMLLNGDFVNRAVQAHPGHPIRAWRQQGFGLAAIVDALFAQILTRPPTQSERRWALEYIGPGTQDWVWEDVQWALFNTREFQFIR